MAKLVAVVPGLTTLAYKVNVVVWPSMVMIIGVHGCVLEFYPTLLSIEAK